MLSRSRSSSNASTSTARRPAKCNVVTPTAKALPPVEKAPESPDQLNEAEGHATAPAAPPQTNANGKKKKSKAPKEDKNDESSSKKKPKKGIDKLNPF